MFGLAKLYRVISVCERGQRNWKMFLRLQAIEDKFTMHAYHFIIYS